MANRYWCKFEYGLWRNDPELRLCSKETRGFWIDCIASMEEKETYFLEGTIDELCRDIVCTEGEFKRSIAQLKRTNAATIEQKGRNVKIVSRRILKSVNLREYNRLKKQEERRRANVKTMSKTPSKDIEIKSLRVLEEEINNETVDINVEADLGKSDPPRKRGSRIPDKFLVTPEMRQWASEETPQVDTIAETKIFVDYWRSKAGAGAVKMDWTLTWKNWMRKEQKTIGNRNGKRNGYNKPNQRTDADVIEESKEFYRNYGKDTA